MITISLCMIVKNEEDVLDRCLDSVKNIVDEIIIVDTGSKDKTKEIAYKYTDKVYDFKWTDDFSLARNFSFSKANKDFILWLDADDVIEEKDRKEFIKLKETLDKNTDVVMMKYNTSFDSEGNVIFSYYRERLLKNVHRDLWKGAVHEAIAPYGITLHSNIAVTHRKLKVSDPDRNLRIFEKMIKEGAELNPRELFYYSRELYYHEKYHEAIGMFQKFLSLKDGFLENKIDAARLLYKCYDKVGDDELAVESLFKSFKYDIPRAEVCCDLGYYFMTKSKYDQAIYWYNRALSCERKDSLGGFVLEDCYNYIPLIQLCVCYDKIGNIKLANEYNELAGLFKPASKEYKLNKKYFKDKLNK